MIVKLIWASYSHISDFTLKGEIQLIFRSSYSLESSSEINGTSKHFIWKKEMANHCKRKYPNTHFMSDSTLFPNVRTFHILYYDNKKSWELHQKITWTKMYVLSSLTGVLKKTKQTPLSIHYFIPRCFLSTCSCL